MNQLQVRFLTLIPPMYILHGGMRVNIYVVLVIFFIVTMPFHIQNT